MGKFEKGNTMGNRFRTNAEATEAGRKGGKARQAQRKVEKSVLANLELLLKNKDEKGVTGFEKMAAALYDKALTGDVQAQKLLLELRGELEKKIKVGTDQPFQVKVIEATEEMSNKISDYLNG